MELTKKLLQKIIKEELNSLIRESASKSKVQDYFERVINGSSGSTLTTNDAGIVGKMWDEIIAHLKMSPEDQNQWIKELRSKTANSPWGQDNNNFVIFYFKKALEELNNGLLDPNNVISGKQMELEQGKILLRKKDIWMKNQEQEKARALSKTPSEKARDEEWAVYGGNPNKNPHGLGT